MKYLINKDNGQRYCLHCKSYECICLPESTEYFDTKFATIVEVRLITAISNKCDKILFRKQILPNGKLIKSGTDLMVPSGRYLKYHGGNKILIDNKLLNALI